MQLLFFFTLVQIHTPDDKTAQSKPPSVELKLIKRYTYTLVRRKKNLAVKFNLKAKLFERLFANLMHDAGRGKATELQWINETSNNFAFCVKQSIQ